MTYTIYTKPACAFCDVLKRTMTKDGVSFTEVYLDTDEKVQQFKEQYPTVRRVPFVLDADGNPTLYK